MRHGKFQNTGDLLHVAGESRKALFDALLITDVHKKFIEHADLTAFIGRNQEAALCHCAQQTRRFQGDGFTTGVRAGDDERIVLFAQRNVHRYTLFGVNERMTRPNERKGAVGADRGLECLHIQSQTSLCQQHINFQHCLVAVLELRLNGGYLCRKCHQNAFDLLRFLCTILQNACICFHNRLRLHKDSSAGGRDIMDDAAHLAAILALNGHNIPSIADGDHTLLQILGGIHIADHAFQPVTDAVFRSADFFAQLVQGVGSRVCHGIRSQNGAGDLLLQPGLRCQRVEQVIRRQGIMFRGAIPAGQVLKVAQSAGHHQQFPHGEHTALDRTGYQRADTLYPAKARRPVFDEQTVDGIGLLQRVTHLIRVALRLQSQQLLSSFLAHAALGCTRNDLIKL